MFEAVLHGCYRVPTLSEVLELVRKANADGMDVGVFVQVRRWHAFSMHHDTKLRGCISHVGWPAQHDVNVQFLKRSIRAALLSFRCTWRADARPCVPHECGTVRVHPGAASWAALAHPLSA